MSSEAQPRVGKGVPAGGEFTAKTHGESPVKLFDADNGTYLNPAPSKTAEHCIGFWSNVQIPDEVLQQMANAYFERWRQENQTSQGVVEQRFQAEWEAEHPRPAKERHVEAWRAEARHATEEHLKEYNGIYTRRPARLSPFDLGNLVRAARLYECAPSPERFPEEREKVMAHPVELYDETLTVREIEDKYGLLDLVEKFDHIEPAAVDELAIRYLREISATLEAEHLQSQADRNRRSYEGL